MPDGGGGGLRVELHRRPVGPGRRHRGALSRAALHIYVISIFPIINDIILLLIVLMHAQSLGRKTALFTYAEYSLSLYKHRVL